MNDPFTTIDPLQAQALRIDVEPEGSADAERQHAALVDFAMQYIHAGCPPWDLWVQLSMESREAMAEAGQTIWQERAVLIGMATGGPDAQAQLALPVDDGAMLASLHLTRALDDLQVEREAEAASIKSPRHARRVAR